MWWQRRFLHRSIESDFSVLGQVGRWKNQDAKVSPQPDFCLWCRTSLTQVVKILQKSQSNKHMEGFRFCNNTSSTVSKGAFFQLANLVSRRTSSLQSGSRCRGYVRNEYSSAAGGREPPPREKQPRNFHLVVDGAGLDNRAYKNMTQPCQSPELNIDDLGFFAYILSRRYEGWTPSRYS